MTFNIVAMICVAGMNPADCSPAPGFSRYRTPIPGLYLSGAGTHPGGGVHGMPGKLAADALLADERGEKPDAGKPSLIALAKAGWRLRKMLN